MRMQYGLAQAKARLSELTHLVDAGQEVVIAKHGRPGYRLVAVSSHQVQSSGDGFAEKPPSSLGDMVDLLTSLRSKSRLPKEPDFVARWRDGDRY
jgi:antitoxin (DNA-binding transcriptional repressor) of toxin-antitoxin stability system